MKMKYLIIYLSLNLALSLSAQNAGFNSIDCQSKTSSRILEKSESTNLNIRNTCLWVKPSDLTLNTEKVYDDGTIIFKNDNYLNLKKIICFLNLSDEITFVKTRETVSRIKKDQMYSHYQQYYKGVIVDNAGFSILSEIETGKILEFSPAIISTLNLDIDNKMSKAYIADKFEKRNKSLSFEGLRISNFENHY